MRTRLQFGASAGLDIALRDWLALRAVRWRARRIVGEPGSDNTYAVSSGVVFRFGGRGK